MPPEPTTPERIGIDYPQLFDVIGPGSRILISDGLIELLVDQRRGQRRRSARSDAAGYSPASRA